MEREMGVGVRQKDSGVFVSYEFKEAKYEQNNVKRIWCSGIIVPSHGTDRGSIPRMRKLPNFILKYYYYYYYFNKKKKTLTCK
ncbi:hypothetical protein JHK82_034577 [Glycine max]|uniref:Uncharacterized protein n=1 Tax=Glycine max TaxID=3847 RepID=A0A0R0HH49_SOYBN|nr:hypothetical protein JHK87_034523 [Glycine soja]KAG4981337.1 hypothetical protein JHK85_035295 [Glycine max]KAG4986959.1 hypothetical protein JHK86_034650 [Glycine max]KAG5120157.1 hypothetical protein JHK82_034577 [Glycine max]KAG5141143.1 hypothetical protein JHK84_034911 [Glycine max]